jgi:hypothetical protein
MDMASKASNTKNARFDTRLSAAQKKIFKIMCPTLEEVKRLINKIKWL